MAYPATLLHAKKAYTSMEPPKERYATSCITGDAQIVYDKVADMLYPPRTAQFLLKALRQGTFDSWGYHEKAGTDVHTCFFHLATWAHMLECPKQTVLRTRDRLIQAKVIWFVPDPDEPGYGRIGWNMNLDEWEPIGPKGGTREGAGNPRFSDPEYQANIHTLKDNNQTSVNTLKAEIPSEHSHFESKTSFKVLKAESFEDNEGQVSQVPLIRIKDPNKDTNNISLVGVATANTTETSSKSRRKKVVSFVDTDEHYKRALYLKKVIQSYAPHAHLPDPGIQHMTKWRETFRLLIEINKHTPEEIKTAIDYLQTSDGLHWRKYVLSADSLRKWITSILLEVEENHQKGQAHGSTRSTTQTTQKGAGSQHHSARGTTQDSGSVSTGRSAIIAKIAAETRGRGGTT